MVYRVVVFDDDESCRKLLELVLSRRGFEVVSLPDPRACPLYMDEECNCPQEQACGDFLITDNRMPRMSGLDFIERQQHRGCKGIVGNKLVVSGTWTADELRRAEALGCKVLQKPFSLNQLLAWLEARKPLIPVGRKLTDLADLA